MPPHPDTSPAPPTAPSPPSHPLPELALAFLKLGLLGFGGPAAHLALMEDEFVRRRNWLSRERFLDLVGAANLIPGPNSTEVALHLGLLRAGLPGLLTAGVCFILPAFTLVAVIAALYTRYGQLPAAALALKGAAPVVLAIIAQAIFKLARTALKTPALAGLALASAAAAFHQAPELLILLAAAALSLLLPSPPSPPSTPRHLDTSTPPPPPRHLDTSTPCLLLLSPAPLLPLHLFLPFLKIGALLFGSGYVLIAFLRSEFIINRPWLTEQQLLDAVAVGQLTPGPVFTTATFIGGILAGFPGALVATIAIFLPAFILVPLTAPLIPRLRASPAASRLLDAVNAASLALMTVAAAHLAHASLTDAFSITAALAAALLLLLRVNTTWLITAAVALSLLRP